MLADICSEIGCYQALNLDGGGSTTLVVCSGPDRECGILNSPSGHQGEGGERIVANHLGIYALDLE